MIAFVFALLVAQDRPVIRLEDSVIQGHVRKPALVELEARKLSQAVEDAALKNLISLEKSLLILRPLPAEPLKPQN